MKFADVHLQSQRADDLVGAGKISSAVSIYEFVLLQLESEPVEACSNLAFWLQASLGDALFQLEEFDRAHAVFSALARRPEGVQNAFVHLRLGQLYFDAGRALGGGPGGGLVDGKPARCKAALLRALLTGGEMIFRGEDPRCLLENRRFVSAPSARPNGSGSGAAARGFRLFRPFERAALGALWRVQT